MSAGERVKLLPPRHLARHRCPGSRGSLRRRVEKTSRQHHAAEPWLTAHLLAAGSSTHRLTPTSVFRSAVSRCPAWYDSGTLGSNFKAAVCSFDAVNNVARQPHTMNKFQHIEQPTCDRCVSHEKALLNTDRIALTTRLGANLTVSSAELREIHAATCSLPTAPVA